MTTQTAIADDEDECQKCGERAVQRTCSRCLRSARIIDCGHKAQPRPIAAGDADGADGHHDYCGPCADAARDTRVRRGALLAELVDLDDGTGDIGVIVDQALAEDPATTAEDVAEIVREARADAQAARDAEVR